MENNPNCLFSNFYGKYRKLFIREFLGKIPQTVYSRILMNNAANCLFSHFDGKCRKMLIPESEMEELNLTGQMTRRDNCSTVDSKTLNSSSLDSTILFLTFLMMSTD